MALAQVCGLIPHLLLRCTGFPNRAERDGQASSLALKLVIFVQNRRIGTLGEVTIFCPDALSNSPAMILDALKMCSIKIIFCHLVYNLSGKTPKMTAWDGPVRSLRAML